MNRLHLLLGILYIESFTIIIHCRSFWQCFHVQNVRCMCASGIFKYVIKFYTMERRRLEFCWNNPTINSVFSLYLVIRIHCMHLLFYVDEIPYHLISSFFYITIWWEGTLPVARLTFSWLFPFEKKKNTDFQSLRSKHDWNLFLIVFKFQFAKRGCRFMIIKLKKMEKIKYGYSIGHLVGQKELIFENWKKKMVLDFKIHEIWSCDQNLYYVLDQSVTRSSQLKCNITKLLLNFVLY